MLVIVGASTVGSANNAILYAAMVHTFLMESVSSVRECVKTTHLVTSQPEHVTMDVVIIGLENFVKSVLMDFTTPIAAAYVDFV